MPIKHFQPKPGRFGVEPGYAQSNVITSITASATTNVPIATPRRKAWIERVTYSVGQTTANFSTLTAQVFKRSAGGDVTLSAAVNINNQTARRTYEIPLTATLTDAQRTLQEGDMIEIALVAGTATQQPTQGVAFVAEILALE